MMSGVPSMSMSLALVTDTTFTTLNHLAFSLTMSVYYVTCSPNEEHGI